jgi:hypothetical protein
MVTSELVSNRNTKLNELELYLSKRIEALELIQQIQTIDTSKSKLNVIDDIVPIFDFINVLPILKQVQTIILEYRLIDSTDDEILKVLTNHLLSELYKYSLEHTQLNGVSNVNLYSYLAYQKYQVLVTLLHSYIKGS